jgi:V8-like Glu-specific endopeptidase
MTDFLSRLFPRGQQTSGGQVRKLIQGGADERVAVDNVEAAPWRTFCCLRINFSDDANRFGYGTGLLIAPRLILTAAHNVYSLGGGHWAKSIAAMVGMKNGQFAAKANVVEGKVARGYRESRGAESFQFDFGVAVLDSDALFQWTGECVNVVDQAPMDNAELERSGVSVAGYPDEDRPNIKLKSAFGGIVAGLTTQANIHYLMDTMPGQSGCPVFKWSAQTRSFSLAGVHVRGANRTNMARRYDARMREQVKAWVAEAG